jgi:hypothetical protein
VANIPDERVDSAAGAGDGSALMGVDRGVVRGLAGDFRRETAFSTAGCDRFPATARRVGDAWERARPAPERAFAEGEVDMVRAELLARSLLCMTS